MSDLAPPPVGSRPVDLLPPPPGSVNKNLLPPPPGSRPLAALPPGSERLPLDVERLQSAGVPEEDIARLKNAARIHQITNIPERQAYAIEPAIRGEESSVGFGQYLFNNLRDGWLDEELNHQYWIAANQELFGLVDKLENTLGKIASIESKMSREPRRRGIAGALGDLALMTPGLTKYALLGLEGAMSGAIATAVFGGSANPLPLEEGVGALVGGTAAMATGSAILQTGYGIKRAFGSTYSMLSAIEDEQGNKIAPIVKYAASIGTAIPVAAVERLQMTKIFSAFPGGEKIFAAASRKAIKTLRDSGAVQRAIQTGLVVGGRIVVDASTELAEEVFQRAISEYMRELTIQISNMTGETNINATPWKTVLSSVGSELNSWGSFLILAAAGETATGIRDYATTRNAEAEADAWRATFETGKYTTPDYELTPPTEAELQAELGIPDVDVARMQAEQLGQLWPETKQGVTEAVRAAREEKVSDLAASLETNQGTGRREIRQGIAYGREEQRSRQRRTEAKEKARRQLRAYTLSLAESIMKPAEGTLDIDYALLVEQVQASLDPKFRTGRTLAGRERTREFLRRNSDWSLPKKVLDKLGKKSLSEMSVEELRDMAKVVAGLRALGKKKLQLKQSADARKFSGDRKLALGAIGVEAVESTQPVTVESAKEPIGRVAKGVTARFSERPPRIFRTIDGGREGANFEIFVDRPNKAYDAELRMQEQRLRSGVDKMKELGLKPTDMAKTRHVPGIDKPMHVDEMMKVYAALKNEKARATLFAERGNNFTPEMAKAVIGALTKEEKALADWIISEYESNYDRLRQAKMDYDNEDLGHEDFYTPLMRTTRDYETMEDELARRVLVDKGMRRGYVEHGFTKERADVPDEYQSPMRLSLVGEWFEQVARQEHFINSGKMVKDLMKLAHDQEFVDAVTEKYGSQYVKAIQNYVNRVGNPNIYRTGHDIDRWIALARRNRAFRHLLFAPKTVLKQAPSVALYLPHAGKGFVQSAANLLRSAVAMAENPYAVMDFIGEKDPQFRNRAVERELEEIKNVSFSQYERIMNTMGRAGFAGIRAMDKVATGIGWKAVYDYSIEQGMSEEEAVRAAQKAMLDTQPSAAAKDIAEIYATNEGFNFVLQFTNQLNQIWNMMTVDIPQAVRRGDYTQAGMAATALAVSGALIWMIDHQRLPQDEDDLKEMLTDQFVNSVPIIGRYITAARDGFSGADIPGQEIIDTAATMMKRGAWRKKFSKAFEETLGVLGAPVTEGKRILKSLQTGDPSYAIFGEPPRR